MIERTHFKKYLEGKKSLYACMLAVETGPVVGIDKKKEKKKRASQFLSRVA